MALIWADTKFMASVSEMLIDICVHTCEQSELLLARLQRWGFSAIKFSSNYNKLCGNV